MEAELASQSSSKKKDKSRSKRDKSRGKSRKHRSSVGDDTTSVSSRTSKSSKSSRTSRGRKKKRKDKGKKSGSSSSFRSSSPLGKTPLATPPDLPETPKQHKAQINPSIPEPSHERPSLQGGAAKGGHAARGPGDSPGQEGSVEYDSWKSPTPYGSWSTGGVDQALPELSVPKDRYARDSDSDEDGGGAGGDEQGVGLVALKGSTAVVKRSSSGGRLGIRRSSGDNPWKKRANESTLGEDDLDEDVPGWDPRSDPKPGAVPPKPKKSGYGTDVSDSDGDSDAGVREDDWIYSRGSDDDSDTSIGGNEVLRQLADFEPMFRIGKKLTTNTPGQVMLGGADQEGWVFMQTGLKSWSEFYFVLKDNLLVYYKDPEDYKPTGMFLLDDCSVAQPGTKYEYVFQIKHPKRKTVSLEGDSKEEVTQWMLALSAGAKRGAPTTLAGYLTKQGGARKTWRRRLFVLRRNMIFYYKPNDAFRLQGFIPVEGCEVEPAFRLCKKANSFAIVHDDRRVFYCYADSEKEMKQWMTAISAAANTASPGSHRKK